VAKQFPELSQYLIARSDKRSTIDFSNENAVRALNRGLLYIYFDLDVTLPSNSLCPAVANRLSYIEWIKANICTDFPPDSRLVGLDIGTGASCIYPLLGVRAMSQCTFIGTDINKESISVASDNVKSNGLEDKIKLYLVNDPNTKLPLNSENFPFPSTNIDEMTLAFCMCNPPFYKDQQERQRLAKIKDCPPTLNTIGKDNELYTTGGEEVFLSGLVDESVRMGKRIRWYSTMVGKKTTLALLKAKIRNIGATFIREGLLVPGKTARWVIAWTF
ncbi:S-adenosyl-L-methionine dependent methyltransferase, partial [Coemansia reversa NRRL 1564]